MGVLGIDSMKRNYRGLAFIEQCLALKLFNLADTKLLKRVIPMALEVRNMNGLTCLELSP